MENHDTAHTNLKDRRDALRQRCRVETLVIEEARMGPLHCEVMDISRKGLRLRMRECIPCGSEIVVRPPHGVDLRMSKARIVRQQVVDRGGETLFECGVQFTEASELRRHTWFLALRCAP